MTTSINERTHFFIKNIPLTLYSRKGLRKGWCLLCVRGELETETDCLVLAPSSSEHSSTSSSFCWAAQPRSWGPNPSVWCWFSLREHPTSNFDWNSNSSWLELCLELQLTATRTELQLTQAVCGTWLYNCLTSTCFLWAYASAQNSTTFTGQDDIPISSTGCTYFLIDGSVEGQNVTEAVHVTFLRTSTITHPCGWNNTFLPTIHRKMIFFRIPLLFAPRPKSLSDLCFLWH